MTKPGLLLAFFMLCTISFAQKKLEISDEKGVVSLEGVQVYPYADGSFSICKHSALLPYSSKMEYFMYHYDNQGNLQGSNKITADSKLAPFNLGMHDGEAVFDNVNKKWIRITIRKNEAEISEWNEKLEMISSVKIPDSEGNAYLQGSNTRLNDGTIVFYRMPYDGKACKRYEYNPASKSLKASEIFAPVFAGDDKKTERKSVFAGLLNNVEFFYTIKKKGNGAVKGETIYTQTLLTYSSEKGMEVASSKDISLYNSAAPRDLYKVQNLAPGEERNLYLSFEMSCMQKECYEKKDYVGAGGFQLIRISEDLSLTTMDFWPGGQLSWSRQPRLSYHQEDESFYLIFQAEESLKAKLDMESKEMSELSSIYSSKFSSIHDLEIFFTDEESEHLKEHVRANNGKFNIFNYTEDAEGKGKLFLFSFGYYYTNLKILMFK